jgi:predicted metal-dependent hydrolase
MLNVDLVQAPIDAFDYVITHEICHVAQNHHGSAYLARISQVTEPFDTVCV